MGATITSVNEYLKRDYIGQIVEQLNLSAVLYNRLKGKRLKISGEDLTARFPVHYQNNEAVGWRAESGTLPTAKNRKHRVSSIALAYLYGSVQITGQTIKASGDSSNAYANVIDNELRGIVETIKQELNSQSYGNGTGVLAQFTNAAAGVIVAGTDVTVANAEKLFQGMQMDGFDSLSGGVQFITNNEITYVDRAAKIIRFGSDFTVPAGPPATTFIFRTGSRGLAQMGLKGITDGPDSLGGFVTTTLQGINGTTDAFWRGNVLDNGGVNRPITLDLMQQAFELGEIRSQARCSLILTTHAVRRSYVNLMNADRRFVRTLDLDGGFGAVEYSGGGAAVPIVVDHVCDSNTVYFPDERTLNCADAGSIDFMDYAGSVFQKVSGKDEYESTLYYYVNMFTSKRSANSVLRDVA